MSNFVFIVLTWRICFAPGWVLLVFKSLCKTNNTICG